MKKFILQLLWLRVEQQRNWLPDSRKWRIMVKRTTVSNREDYGTRSSATISDSWSYATAEMMRRDTYQEEVLSQLRSELQLYNRHAEGPPDEFQQSQAQVRHTLERSNTEGVRLRNLCEETRTANASIAPEVTRLQAREVQLPTRVSTMRSQETELQGQLPNLHQENIRINAPMNQIQITNSAMNTGNQEWAKQLQTSNLKLSRSKTEVSYLRTIRPSPWH